MVFFYENDESALGKITRVWHEIVRHYNHCRGNPGTKSPLAGHDYEMRKGAVIRLPPFLLSGFVGKCTKH